MVYARFCGTCGWLEETTRQRARYFAKKSAMEKEAWECHSCGGPDESGLAHRTARSWQPPSREAAERRQWPAGAGAKAVPREMLPEDEQDEQDEQDEHDDEDEKDDASGGRSMRDEWRDASARGAEQAEPADDPAQPGVRSPARAPLPWPPLARPLILCSFVQPQGCGARRRPAERRR